tara:strand:- start:155 stop:568 length:414 start_codon:yes stop_codon:yes gene_type:complete
MSKELNEKEKTKLTIDWLNNKFNLLIQKTTGEFYLWDAQDDERIIEFKFRKEYFKEKYIQVDKFYCLLMAAEYYEKNAYYIVVDNEVRIFNLTKLKNQLINKKIIIKKAPYQTEFKNNNKINKYFYTLSESNQINQL